MIPSTSSRNAATCSWSRPCPKCALLEVIRHRFRAFEVKFGRKPAPDEPLFFDPRKSHPVLASQPEIREQIRVAASASQLKVSPILRLLKLDQHSPAKEGTEACQRASRGHPHASGLTEHRPEARHQRAWELFVRNENLHRRYGITGSGTDGPLEGGLDGRGTELARFPFHVSRDSKVEAAVARARSISKMNASLSFWQHEQSIID